MLEMNTFCLVTIPFCFDATGPSLQLMNTCSFLKAN